MIIRATRHNGRSGKNGIYNPKHNDRNFYIKNSDHINSEVEIKNVYWDCYNGFREAGNDEVLSFEDVEKKYYEENYKKSVEAQNTRNEKNRHPERNRTVEDLLKDKRTCPEETILQIGDMFEHTDSEMLKDIAMKYFEKMEKLYGEHYHILDWSLHVDEKTPHIHERHVFDSEDKYGYLKPQQEKALETMGIPLPEPDRPASKNNSRKKTFDSKCRDLFNDICNEHNVHVETEPVYGKRKYMEKEAYIEFNVNKRLKAAEEQLKEKDEHISAKEAELNKLQTEVENREKYISETSDIAYEKACDVLTEEICELTAKGIINYLVKTANLYADICREEGRELPAEFIRTAQFLIDGIRNYINKLIEWVKEFIGETDIPTVTLFSIENHLHDSFNYHKEWCDFNEYEYEPYLEKNEETGEYEINYRIKNKYKSEIKQTEYEHKPKKKSYDMEL